MNSFNPAHAILIPGLLRAIDSAFLDVIRDLGKNAMVFILTERKCSVEAKQISSVCNASVHYVEDIPEYRVQCAGRVFGGGRAQIAKISLILQVLTKWERINGHEFRYIHKIRTDIRFGPSLRMLTSAYSESRLEALDGIWCHWDFLFSGTRDHVLRITNFADFVRTTRVGLIGLLLQLNQSHLESSDPACWPSSLFPIAIVQEKDDPNSAIRKLRSTYKDSQSAILAFSRHQVSSFAGIDTLLRTIEEGGGYILCWNGKRLRYRSPTPLWARFLNFTNIQCNSYGVNAAELELKASRFALNDFSRILLESIDNSDYCLLADKKTDWISELGEYEMLGGNPAKLMLVLANAALKDRDNLGKEEIASLRNILLIIDPRVADSSHIAFRQVFGIR